MLRDGDCSEVLGSWRDLECDGIMSSVQNLESGISITTGRMIFMYQVHEFIISRYHYFAR